MRDEFGREIPGRGGSSTNSHSNNQNHINYNQYGNNNNNTNSYSHTGISSFSQPSLSLSESQYSSALLLMSQPLSSSRYTTTTTVGGGGGNSSRHHNNHHLPPLPNRHSTSYRTNINNNIPLSSSSQPPLPSTTFVSSSSSATTPPVVTTNSTNNNNNNITNQNHASARYIRPDYKPLLCEFRYHEEQRQLQKEEEQEEEQRKKLLVVGSMKEDDHHHRDTDPNSSSTDHTTFHNNENKDTMILTTTTTTTTDKTTTGLVATDPKNNNNNNNEEYIEYMKNYCLRYIYTFFNEHFDDPWFRYMYSPYHIYYTIQQARYTNYINIMELVPLKEMLQYMSSLLVSNQVHEQEDDEENKKLQVFQNYMDQHLRLWERQGMMITNQIDHENHHPTTNNNISPPSISFFETPKAHLLAFQQAATYDTRNVTSTTTSSTSTSTTTTLSALHIKDIPTYMSDNHIMIALRNILVVLYTPQPPLATTAETTEGTTTTTAAAAAVPSTSSSTPLPQLQIWPSQQMVLQRRNIYYYTRDVIVTGPVDTIQRIIQYLASPPRNNNNITTSTTPTTITSPDRMDIPRKQLHPPPPPHHHPTTTATTNTSASMGRNDPNVTTSTSTSSYYGMVVECSDLYGRKVTDLEHLRNDPTSKGSLDPKDSSILRTYEVMVSLLPMHNYQNYIRSSNNNNNSHYAPTKNVTVRLSAALSSTERIEYDTNAAYQIAMALDDLYHIPSGLRIHDLLNDASICHDQLWTYQSSDKLDFIIAYLRRVHLFSYYNGCCFVNHSLCDVATGKNAVSTIHVRMKNADAFLQNQQKATTEFSTDDIDTPAPPKKKDLLVQRLDDAIAKALHEYCGITEPGDAYHGITHDNPNPNTIAAERQAELIQDAKAIQEAQDAVQHKWLSKHANVVTPDGRARCSSFFNCGKLFKDSTFLCKHLLKKHSEHLHAEQATCHDEFIKKAWEKASVRPIPDILVDCGSIFGTVACPVIGATPTCIDPEPELWRVELERRQRAEEMRLLRSEKRNQQQQQQQQQQQYSPPDQFHQQQQQQSRPPPRVNNFIDVDDMKVEKVAISFDDVIVPDVVTTTAVTMKKKKRKLL